MTAPDTSALRPRLEYLDGMRAVAATYVVMFHAVLGFSATELAGPWRLLRRLLAFGHEAVAVFIVLSGYCLMLPVARNQTKRLSGSLSAYFARRAFRILPPYFITLAGSLLLIAAVPALQSTGTGTIWDNSLPALELAPIASHLALVHNWFPDLSYRINGPLWSVATEWQIYFFFPLLLLPLWRRFGLGATFIVAAALGYLPLLFARDSAMTAIPWYLTLFALGMAAALVNFSIDGSEARLRDVRWTWVSRGLWAFCLVFGMAGATIWFRFKPLTDLLVGAATAALLVQLTEAVHTGGERSALLRILESRVAQSIGRCSYSLYLTHLPVVALCYFTLQPRGLSAPALASAMLVLGVFFSFCIAYPFHWLVERRFLRGPAAFAESAKLTNRVTRAVEGHDRRPSNPA